MASVVAKWGNSLGLRLPKSIIEQLGVKEGTELDLVVENGRLVIQPRRYSLEALMAEVTPENFHGEMDWGSAVGDEAW
jgi:antitoxin MazE